MNQLNSYFFRDSNEKIKLFFKNSYILLSWFYYLTTFTKKKKAKFYFLPKKTFMFTNTKAPMAHKTFSKEQFQFKLFQFKIKFSNFYSSEKPLSANSALYLLLTTKSFFFQFETNFFQLKYFTLAYQYCDPDYFNYFTFLKEKIK